MATYTVGTGGDFADWAAVVYGAGVGEVKAGDTLDGQGETFYEVLTVGASGTAGSPITFTNCTIDAQLTRQNAVNGNNKDYVAFTNVTALNSSTSLTGANFNIGTGTGVELIDCVTSGGRLGVSLGGTAFLVDGLLATGKDITLDIINIDVPAISGTIRNCDLRSIDANSSDVIEVQGDNITTLVIQDNLLIHGDGDKSVITAKEGTGVITIERNDIRRGDTNVYGVRTEANFAGTINLYGNVFSGFGATSTMVQIDNATTVVAYNIVGNVFVGGRYQVQVGNGATVTLYNNSFYYPTDRCLYVNGTAGNIPSVKIKNNLFLSNALYINDWGYAVSMELDYNAYYGTGTWEVTHHAYTTLAALVAGEAAKSYEVNGVFADPCISSDYMLGNSALETAGVWIAGVRLHDDLPAPLHPPIGAKARRDFPGRRFGAGGGTL